MSLNHSSVIFSLLDAPAWGGAEEYVFQNLLSTITDYDVVVATNNQQVKQKIEKTRIKVIKLPYVLDAIGNWKGLIKYFLSLPYSIFWFIRRLRKLKKQYQQVICIFPGYSDRLTFSPIAKFFGVKLLWWEFGPLEPTFKKNWGFPKFLFDIGRKFPDKIITISKTTRNSLIQTGKITPSKIQLIYPGTREISDAQYHHLRNTAKQWMQKNGILDKTIMTCLGRITTEKEFELVLQSISKLRKNVQEKIHLIVIGSGPNLVELEQLTKQLEIEKITTFTGFVSNSEKKHILAISDIFVFPSAWELEGFGITTIEAMMTRNAIITTGHGPQAEIIENGKSGLYFEPKNSADLANRISILVHNTKLLKKLQKSAQKCAMEKFSLVDMQTKFQQLLTEI